MIVFDLECRVGGHKFEGWFASSQNFADQQERGLLACPECGSADVGKALMAPHVARKGNQLPQPIRSGKPVPAEGIQSDTPAQAGTAMASKPLQPEAAAFMQKLAAMQAEVLKSSRFVGKSFAEDARAMHYGERETEAIHGQATIAEAMELLEEGVAVAPLPFPVIPPAQAN